MTHFWQHGRGPFRAKVMALLCSIQQERLRAAFVTLKRARALCTPRLIRCLRARSSRCKLEITRIGHPFSLPSLAGRLRSDLRDDGNFRWRSEFWRDPDLALLWVWQFAYAVNRARCADGGEPR